VKPISDVLERLMGATQSAVRVMTDKSSSKRAHNAEQRKDDMEVKARKPRRKKLSEVTVVHRVHGEGRLIERRATPTGSDVLLVEFPDKTARTLLASPQFWQTPAAQLAAIPVSKVVAPGDDAPETAEPVIDDTEPEAA
jgi:hypothetical protein